MLRAIGLLDLVAIIAVFSPRTWFVHSHHMLGMGDFPHEPIAGYLARCTSIWYASYGLLLWFVSFDVAKYSQLIRILAWAMFVQGFIVMGIDIAEGMPRWWIALEGPCCSGLGAGLLLLQRRTESTSR
jgi:hypothetical protein